MPRKNPVPAHEIAICRRLREFREIVQISQAGLARDLGFKESYITHLEHGRAPISVQFAVKLFSRIPINPVWLATGEGPRVGFPVQVPIELYEGFNGPFSVFFNEQLTAFITSQNSISFRDEDSDRPLSHAEMHELLCALLQTWLPSVPEDSLDNFFSAIERAAKEELCKYPKQTAQAEASRSLQIEQTLSRVAIASRQGQGNNDLTNTGKPVNTSPVAKGKTLVENLIAEVKGLTEARGARTRLARYLGVTPQRLNDWLSGEHEPSAETTLALNAWVNDPAEQQKTLQDVLSTPKGKVTRKHSNENAGHKSKRKPQSRSRSQ